MSRWFRHYAGMMRDEKLVRVALKSQQPIERVLWIWGAILESASEVNENGRFDFDTGEAAYFLRTDESDIHSVLSELEALGRILDGCVVKWGNRQFQSDNSGERVRRHRKQKADGENNGGQKDGLGDCNGGEKSDVTLQDRYKTVTKRKCNAPDTETDTETDVNNPPTPQGEGSKVEFPPELAALPGFEKAWGEWEQFRCQKKQKLTPIGRQKQLAYLARQPRDAVAMLDRSMTNGWTGIFPLDKPPPGLSTNANPSTPDYPPLE